MLVWFKLGSCSGLKKMVSPSHFIGGKGIVKKTKCFISLDFRTVDTDSLQIIDN